MHPVAKWLIFAGIILIILGFLWQAGSKFLRLGRLPGDIVIERENFRLYLPIATSIVVSILLSLVLSLIALLFRHR